MWRFVEHEHLSICHSCKKVAVTNTNGSYNLTTTLLYGLTHPFVSLLIVMTHKCAQSDSFISVVLLWLCSVSVIITQCYLRFANTETIPTRTNQNKMCFRCEKQLLNAKDLAQKISVRPFSITAHPDLRVTVALEPVPAGFSAEAGLHPGQVASSS